MAKASITANTLIAKLKEQLTDTKRAAQIWKERYEKLWDQTYDYVQALKRMPMQVKNYLHNLLHTERGSDNIRENTLSER